jgi:hypothetical protein
VPPGQFVGDVAPVVPTYVPAGAGVQAVAPPVEYVPTAHGLVLVAPEPAWYRPGSAGTHADEPVTAL